MKNAKRMTNDVAEAVEIAAHPKYTAALEGSTL